MKHRAVVLYVGLFAALICTLGGAAAWTATASPALGLDVKSAPTRAAPYGHAELPKPTFTFTPTVTPTPTPIPYAQAEVLQDTPMPDGETVPLYSGNKYILVDISEQHMYVYEGDALIYSFVSSTGMYNGTRAGYFSVLNKIPNAYGATWDIWMPNWLGIYWSGGLQNGIHALPILPNGATLWSGYLGTPVSYGCVVLGGYEAQLLYDWAELGTPVEIRR